jgi:nicotinamidase-related amidase
MKATALLLIDVQQAFEDPAWGPRNNPQAEGNLRRLLAAFRTAGLPVIHVKHDSTEPDSTLRPECPGNALMRGMEPLFGKTVNSAFIGTGLEAHLRSRGIEGLVIGGFITNHCVSTTARMAGNLGFRTVVVADACATFDFRDADGVIPAETMHRIGLAELRSEFAEILDTEMVLARF